MVPPKGYEDPDPTHRIAFAVRSCSLLPAALCAWHPDTCGRCRRHWLRVHYDNRFDLAAEIGAIVGPLAAEISYLPHPLSMRGDVEVAGRVTARPMVRGRGSIPREGFAAEPK